MHIRIAIGLCALTLLTSLAFARDYENLPVDQPVHCPVKLVLDEGKYDFSSAELVGGHMPDLKPITPDREGKWNLEDYRPSKRVFELVCHFEDTDTTVTVPIPRNMYLCDMNGDSIVCR